jgi:rhodanese-related sulfurtransferase
MTQSGEDVTVGEALGLLNEGATLLDVREPEEFDAGRAIGAEHVPLMELPDRLDELPSGSIIVCVCRVGNRSARAAAFLASRGLDARNLAGGMVAWVQAGESIVGDGDAPEII